MVVSDCASRSSVSAALDDPSLTTASIGEPTQPPEGMEKEDLKAIQKAMASAPHVSPARPLSWINPESGNEGTITVLEEFMDGSDQKCRKFETRADTFMGVSMYDGEACEVRVGYWAVNWLTQRAAQ